MNFRASIAILLLLACMRFTAAAQAAVTYDQQSELSSKVNVPIYEWVDKERATKATIVAIHGLTFYGAAYENIANHLAQNGLRFVAMDIRGFGRWRTEHAKYRADSNVHFGQTLKDVISLVQTIKSETPDQKVFLLGESLGANMALDIVSNNPELCDGAIISSPGYKFKLHARPKLVADTVRGLRHPKTKMDLTPYIAPYLSEDKAITAECLKDTNICRALSPVELLKARKTNLLGLKNVGKIRPTFPILVMAGTEDGVFKTKDLPEFLAKFGTRDLDVHILKKGHLLLEHQTVQPEIATAIDQWLGRKDKYDQIAKSSALDETRRN